jgi:hypothetical protein
MFFSTLLLSDRISINASMVINFGARFRNGTQRKLRRRGDCRIVVEEENLKYFQKGSTWCSSRLHLTPPSSSTSTTTSRIFCPSKENRSSQLRHWVVLLMMVERVVLQMCRVHKSTSDRSRSSTEEGTNYGSEVRVLGDACRRKSYSLMNNTRSLSATSVITHLQWRSWEF